MLHGNPLLRGWELSDVSFYTTELPQYMVLEVLRGLHPGRDPRGRGDDLHAGRAAAPRCWPRAGRPGGPGLLRAALAAGIMLAPQQNGGVYVLMLLARSHRQHGAGAGHLDPARPRAAPLVGAARRRAAAGLGAGGGQHRAHHRRGPAGRGRGGGAPTRRSIRDGRPLRSAWFELALVAAALAAVGAATEALDLLAAAGGFYVWPVDDQLAAAGQLGGNLAADRPGPAAAVRRELPGPQRRATWPRWPPCTWPGSGWPAWAVCVTVRRAARGRAGRPRCWLPASCSAWPPTCSARTPWTCTAPASSWPCCRCGAALAGRVLAGRLHAARMTPALAVVATAYLLSLGRVMALPAAPAAGHPAGHLAGRAST